MVLGPLLLLLGAVLRLPCFFSFPPERFAALEAHPTYFPLQLAAFEAHPTLMVASYGSVLAGSILMWPAAATLARLISAKRPGWALWGGALAIFGLFVNTFHAGVNYFAFQLVRVQNLELATQAVADSYVATSYGPYRIVVALAFVGLFGWPILAVGAYRSGTLGLVRSVPLGLMGMLGGGVLKGSTWESVVETAAVCVALVPLGVQVMRGLRPGVREATHRPPGEA
ncbi:MAG: hypothetical protein L0Z62_30945 [Gemmataceae bacterium]|nr:hypothetical protein [Gemmataceae bacterium]